MTKPDNPPACEVVDLAVARFLRKLNRKARALLPKAAERYHAMLAERTKQDER